eukprot:477387-Hanusia_phi.AAC.6
MTWSSGVCTGRPCPAPCPHRRAPAAAGTSRCPAAPWCTGGVDKAIEAIAPPGVEHGELVCDVLGVARLVDVEAVRKPRVDGEDALVDCLVAYRLRLQRLLAPQRTQQPVDVGVTHRPGRRRPVHQVVSRHLWALHLGEHRLLLCRDRGGGPLQPGHARGERGQVPAGARPHGHRLVDARGQRLRSHHPRLRTVVGEVVQCQHGPRMPVPCCHEVLAHRAWRRPELA